MSSPDLPPDLTAGLDVERAVPVGGGDTAAAYRLETARGPLFAKTVAGAPEGMLATEVAGVEALREHAPPWLGVPEVVRWSAGGIVLEWIEEGGRPGRATEEELGRGLALLHRTRGPHYGALDPDLPGWIGSSRPDMSPAADWARFLLERRIRPLLHDALAGGRIDPVAEQLLAELAPRARELAGPAEPPTLVHGDLWAGNRLVDVHGRNWLIDPSSYWGHREIDLAMMLLFGGFGEACFAAYAAEHPPAAGWRDRVPWYQLPPLLRHAYRFGGGYGDAAVDAMRRLLG
ncbi:fructosamine kinase family protein [Kocuria flava]|uniref:fructosamine kinase family protein n=1 Tax=Kocuria flava TaxID=446860 RepID=UPI001FF38869|nr:fructosamine kinase family protein [Kocuria flava]MCJ8505350.1 fructosamine kinase family protein [Kocuria flava]